MRDSSFPITKFAVTALAVLGLYHAPAAVAGNINSPPTSTSQVGSLSNNYNADSQGSDNSLRSSSIYIMQALMDLNNTQLVSAVKNGYQAYGKYRNAENLDRLKDQSATLANAMGSVDSAPLYASTYTNTTFERLDPNFLHQGPADAVAAEFERETGMKRDDFLAQIGSISDQKIKRSDPMMIDKAFSHFESFIQKIPNAEFRKNAERNIALVPNSVRRGMIAQAVSKLAGYFADAGPASPAPGASSVTDLAKGKIPEDVNSNASAAAASKTGDASRDPAAVKTGSAEGASIYGKTGAEGAVAAALLAQGQGNESSELTIFQQVTKRIRILSPQFQTSKSAN